MTPPPSDPPSPIGLISHCPTCRAMTPRGARFCGNCGSPLALFCPACAAPAAAGQRFCTECGASIEPGAAKSAAVAEDGTAERRFMTVLFCDIVGSSELAARLDPEEFAALLVSYRERCAAAVAQNGGWMSRYAGDGVIACFGYPRAVGRDAQAAVACGLAIAQGIGAVARGIPLPDGGDLAVRIGIETGLVVAGRLGPGAAMEFDAFVGTAPNVAARLQQVAAPNSVVIGEATHELVCNEFECEELSPERLVRLQPAARAFVVRGETKGRGKRLVVTRRHVPMVGRTAELMLLRELWGRVVQGQGQTVLITGEPGIGKSRLGQELLDHIAETPHAMIVVSCAPHAAGTAFHPAIEALREELVPEDGTDGTATTEQTLAKLFAKIGLDDPRTIAVVAEALGLGPGPPDLAAGERRRLLLQALEAWLLHRATDCPVLILAEDLHWSDPSLLELLQRLNERLPSLQAMLLATYRSDFVLPWPNRSNTLRVTLSPLNRPDAEQLLDALARQQSVETREAILARSDGIPLFLEEFALAAGRPAVPRTLQQLFTARLDALADIKRLAQSAAILAPQLEPDLLAALTGLPATVVEAGLERLVDAEVLMRSGALPTGRFFFRHALIQQAASESVLMTERRGLHARVAAALTMLRPALVERQPEIIAEHHVLGGEFAAAVPLFARASRRALAAAALEEAETLVRRGLVAVAEVAPLEAEAELELRVLLGHVLIARRGYASAAVQQAFESALGSAERVREEARILPALRGLASFYQVRGPLSRAEAICNRLVTAAERAADPCMLVDAWRRRGWNHGCRGNLVQAQEDLARAFAAFDPALQDEHIACAGHDPRVIALANLCWLDLPQHGPTMAAQRAAAAAKAAEASPHPVSACYGFVFAALVLQQAQQWDEALRLAERARAIADDKGIAYWVAMSMVAIGYDQAVHGGNLAAGREAMQSGLASYRETQGELLRPFILSLIAEADVALGDVEAAVAAIREAIEVAEVMEAQGFLPELLLRQARLMVGPAGQPRRQELLGRALAMARAQGAEAVARTAGEAIRAP
jgi:class 3 adenylate cyclase/tetratricopeptide (TPR) repeat protein